MWWGAVVLREEGWIDVMWFVGVVYGRGQWKSCVAFEGGAVV